MSGRLHSRRVVLSFQARGGFRRVILTVQRIVHVSPEAKFVSFVSRPPPMLADAR
jgi:hypothetical protein